MFDSKFSLRPAFLDDAAGLRRRFRIIGALNLLIMPFMLLFVVVYFLLKHGEEMHKGGDRSRNSLGMREWSPLALWQLRDFHELPHRFEARVAASYRLANAYTRHFSSPLGALLGRAISFVAGALIGVLLLFTLADENLLLYIKIADRNLLWCVRARA